MQPPDLRMGAAEWAMLLFLSVLWGGSFFFIKIAVGELAPFTVVLCRVAIGAALLAVVVRLSGYDFPKTLSGWLPYGVMGLLNNVIPFSLITWGEQEIGSGLAAVLNASTPLFGAIIAHILTTDEKLRSNRLVGVLVGIAGVAVLIGPSGFNLHVGPLLGAAAVLLASMSYGFSSVWGKRFRGVPALTTSCCQLTCSTLMMLPLVIVFDQPWQRAVPGVQVLLAVAALGVISTALAYVIFFTILRRAGASNVILVTLLVPLTASALGIVFLGEFLRSTDLVGAALIAMALLVIDGRPFAALRRMAAGGSPA